MPAQPKLPLWLFAKRGRRSACRTVEKLAHVLDQVARHRHAPGIGAAHIVLHGVQDMAQVQPHLPLPGCLRPLSS